MDDETFIKTRHVCFKPVIPNGQAARACLVLQGVNGVKEVLSMGPNRIKLTYSLSLLNFELIEALLKELDFELDQSFGARLYRYYYQYMEDTALEKLVIEEDQHHLSCCVDPLIDNKKQQYWSEYH